MSLKPIALAVLSAACLSLPSIADAPTTWTPAASILPKLADFQNCGNYEIRPPKGYVAKFNSNDAMEGFAWASGQRSDGTQTYIMVVEGKPPADVLKGATTLQVIQAFVRGVGRNRNNFNSTPPTYGSINGIKFARCYWHGTAKQNGAKMHGFVYGAIDGDEFVELASQDLDKYWSSEQPLTEASALTFRRKLNSNPQHS